MAIGIPGSRLLMLFSTVVSFTAGLGMLRWADPGRRKLCLVVPVTADLLLLGFFKYANFGLATAHDLASLGRASDSACLTSISSCPSAFHSTRSTPSATSSTAIAGSSSPTRNFFEFAAYVSLFSQLVAGPIVRFRQIEQDLENLGGPIAPTGCMRGISFFVIGMVEKVVVADSLAAFVDPAAGPVPVPVDRWRVARDAGLFVPALLRLLGLQHDGGRPGIHVRPAHSSELQLALQGARSS